MSKAAELREMTLDELGTKLSEARSELFNLRFQVATAQLSNVARIGTLKREIARILTLLREKELEIASGGEGE